jgi:superfamily II DNA or RNA helicase
MKQSEKITLTAINKIDLFNNIIKKLTINEDLIDKEKTYILSCAILFIREYENNKSYSSYLEIAYYIILKYSFKYNDYEPLYDIATNFGFYPISKYIIDKELLVNINIEDVIIDNNLNAFKNNNYIETFEQKKQRTKLLASERKEKSYIAPTSFGKSSIIIEYLQLSKDKKIGIIVPTKSLLSQTYKLLKELKLEKRILIHDEMFDNDNSFIAIFTQERALRLLDKNDTYFDTLFIDEAHNLFDKSARSVLLSRLIKKNKALNDNQNVIYLSPLIMDSNNLKYTNTQNISEQRIHFNIKEPDIFEYRLDNKVYQYNRFVNEFYFLNEYSNQIDYINEKSQRKNFFYIRSPKKIEKFSKLLDNKKDVINDLRLEELSNILKENIHEEFYSVEYIKKGILYIHGKMPDLIKEYLEYKFKEVESLKYIVANTVILEGINFPIDTIFILNTHSLQAKELTNLIGRANRLNQIFLEDGSNNLYKLLPKIHFINSNNYNRKKSNMTEKIKLLRSRIFEDKIQNPTLESFDIDKLPDDEKLKPLKIKYEEDFILNTPQNEFDKIKKYLIEVGIYNIYNNGKILIEHILNLTMRIENNKEKWESFNMMDKIYLLFIKGLENTITEYEFKRLENNDARKYYEMHISNSHKYTLNENINKLYEFFLKKRKTTHEFYVGKTYGEISKSTEPYPNSRNEVYVNLKEKNKKELINLAIVKLKIEDDFISFQLNKFITMMYDYNLIREEEYNMYIYGTTNKNKSSLRKIGLSGSLISRLEEAGQLDNIKIDEFNNIVVNEQFEKYKNSVDDFYRFEISKFL